MPSYRRFVRTVWSWRDPHGRSCLDAPPWVFTVFITEPIEIGVVSSMLQTLCRGVPEIAEKFEVLSLEDGTEFSFADLESLHSFLSLLTTIGMRNETARRVVEYILWSLGFRWV